LKILFIGDIFGNPGRKAAKEMVQKLKKERQIDSALPTVRMRLEEAELPM